MPPWSTRTTQALLSLKGGFVPLEHIELASLNAPDDPQTRARFAELTHQGGVQLQPAKTYNARDPGGLITVTVNRYQLVTTIRIRPRWYEQLRPEAFPAALCNTYITAVQRALAVESVREAPEIASAPVRREHSADPEDMSIEEFLVRTRERLDAVDAQYEAIKRQDQAPNRHMTEIRSPLGYLTMRLRDGGPISIHGDPQALDNPSDAVLAEDSLLLFVRAGFGVDPGDRPRPAARPDSTRTGGDDEYFDGFRVLGGRDGNG